MKPTGHDMRSADAMLRNSNRLGCEFVELINVDIDGGRINAVIRDSCGFLWICREECHENNKLFEGRGIVGHQPFFMPIYGPCPDPVEELPAGYSAHSTAMLAEAAAIIKRGGVRKVAA